MNFDRSHGGIQTDASGRIAGQEAPSNTQKQKFKNNFLHDLLKTFEKYNYLKVSLT